MRTFYFGAISVALALLQANLPAAAQVRHAKYIGPFSCGSWTSGLQVGKGEAALSSNSSTNNALMLNWLLGYWSNSNEDILADVDVPSVTAWLDNYCQANPLAALTEAAFALRSDVLKRRKPLAK